MLNSLKYYPMFEFPLNTLISHLNTQQNGQPEYFLIDYIRTSLQNLLDHGYEEM